MSEVAICPVEDCKLTVDVALKSSDGELFGAHQRNLEMYTEGFPIAGSTVVSDPVSLEETAEVLRLLLRYTHHIRQIRIDEVSFTLLASLAEAVEKYIIYSAMEPCRLQMTQATGDHPNEVFIYSVKHNYPDLADKAARLTLNNSVSDFLALLSNAGLPDGVALRWTRYHDRWMKELVQLPARKGQHSSSSFSSSSFSSSSFSSHHDCYAWDAFQLKVFEELRRDLSSLSLISSIIDNHSATLGQCLMCHDYFSSWRPQVTQVARSLPKYSEI